MVKRFNQLANIMVCSLVVILTYAAGNVNAQLVTNGSFENTAPGPVAGNDIEGWVIEVGAAVNPLPDFEIVADPVQHGNHALKVVVHAVGPNAWSIQVIADSIPVEPGKTYRFSIWAKTDNPGSQANFTVGNYAFNEYGVIRPATLSTEWREFTFEFAITDQETFARAPIHFSIAANVGDTIYLDNLKIELPGEVWTGPPLASGKSKFFGCAHSNAQAPNFAAYWNQVTPENAGKWGSVEGSRDVMNWGGLDAPYNFAKTNGFPFRFHVLIWGNQQPAWIESLPASEQLEEIEEWFAAVAARYPDIDYLEVVNEPLHDPPDGPTDGNYIEALGGRNGLYGTGWDWVIKSFELAREYFPDSTKLMINDYSIVNDNGATTNYLNIISLLMQRELIDGIGIQGHAFSTRGSVTTMTNNLNRLAQTGLPIQVCEMDIDGPTDQVQLNDYQRIFPTFWEHPAVEGITLWGWRPGLWRNAERAYLVDQNGDERPALVWLRDYIQSTTVSVGNPVVDIPQTFYLSNNYPNPFWSGATSRPAGNPSTRIAYSVPRSGYISLKVYNLLGKEVATLFEGVQLAGNYVAAFDGRGLAGGAYFYQLKANNFQETKKLILLK